MKLHILEPYDLQKNLGKAYNEAMVMIPEGDAACLKDIDTCFLHPTQPAIINEYISVFDTAVLTCYTNRVSTLSVPQLLNGSPDDSADMRLHIERARLQLELKRQYTPITRDISGFLLVLTKQMWKRFPFPETGAALGVDTIWNREVRKAGVQILRMDSVYVWHSYRLINGILDRAHLK